VASARVEDQIGVNLNLDFVFPRGILISGLAEVRELLPVPPQV